MRNLAINKKTFYVLNYIGKTENKDVNGFETGEYIIEYSSPIEVKAHISGAKGQAQIEMFGTDLKYDKSIVLSKKLRASIGITENSVLFVDKGVEYDNDQNPLYDYKVIRINETINEVAIAIERVSRNA